MELSQREKTILNIITKEYIKTAEPIGSSLVAEKYGLGISSATIRNDMASLEEQGYIIQPHTSAGRVPTEKAYLLYLSEIKEKSLNTVDLKVLDKAWQESERAVAKTIAALANNAVFWAFHKNDLYYTGFSNLLSQPEFKQTNLIYDISVVIDRMDEIIFEIFEKLENGTQILVGANNPFSPACSAVLVKYRDKRGSGLFGIIGPMRQDYAKTTALVNYLKDKLK
jgi:heat-inducible transcriptional repressor